MLSLRLKIFYSKLVGLGRLAFTTVIVGVWRLSDRGIEETWF